MDFTKISIMKTLLFMILASFILFGSSCLKDDHIGPDYSDNIVSYGDAQSEYNLDSLNFLLGNIYSNKWASNNGDTVIFNHIINPAENIFYGTALKFDSIYPTRKSFYVYPNGDNSLKFEDMDNGNTIEVTCTMNNENIILEGIEFLQY